MEAFNANHSYFWDDRNGSCCGASNQESCHEGGPGSGDVCKKVAESEGKEDDIMKCCKGQKAYIPLVNDCFTDVKQCLGGCRPEEPEQRGSLWPKLRPVREEEVITSTQSGNRHGEGTTSSSDSVRVV